MTYVSGSGLAIIAVIALFISTFCAEVYLNDGHGVVAARLSDVLAIAALIPPAPLKDSQIPTSSPTPGPSTATSSPTPASPRGDSSDQSAVTAIIAGAFSIVVAVLAATLSYIFSTRTARDELAAGIATTREAGAQDRETAEREYQLEAMKRFREAVGGPKSQIIETVHDLSDRLRRFLSAEQTWEWTKRDGYYRRSFVWLIARPFVWIEILRRSMIHLDQTLGDLVKDELRFLSHCRLLERSLTEAQLFRGTDYDSNVASAHIFAGDLRAIAERMIEQADSGTICMTYGDFEKAVESATSPAQDVERIVSNLTSRGRVTQFRIARLIALWCATNAFLQDFKLPYRETKTVDDGLACLELIRKDLQETMRSNISSMVSSGIAPSSTQGGSNGT